MRKLLLKPPAWLRLGLLPRLLLALTLVGLVPLAVIQADRGRVEGSLREQVLRMHALAARSTAERVDAFLETEAALASSLANNPEIYGAPASPAAGELLAGMLQARTEVIAIALTNVEGEEFLRAQRKELVPLVDSLLEGVSGQRVQVHRRGEDLWLRLDEPFADGSGVVRQVVSGEALEEALQPKEIGREAELVLADARGEVVAGSLDDLAALPPSLVTKALTGRLSGVAGESDEVVGAFSPLSTEPWVVISSQPRVVAEEIATLLRRRTRLALAGAVLAVGLISLVGWGSVVRPIRRLITAQRSLAGLEPAPAAGSELHQLQEALGVLERRVREREALGKVFLGRYQVLEVLGEGGMGTVFHGWDPKLQRPVALKTLRLSTEKSPEDRQRKVSELLSEAVATARIRHPNVVAVYDLMEQGDAAFIAMELVDGITLEDYLGRYRRLRPGRAVSLTRAIACGLGAAHAQGIVHHDVKPGNVLLGWDGEIKVVDFGIARFLSNVEDEREKVFGTPGYLPPEALRGKGYTEAGDLFGLGVVLYQCLTGARPFTGTSVRDVVLDTITGDPPPPSVVAPGIPPELDRLVEALLEKDPQARLPSSEATLAALETLPSEPWSLDGFDRADRKGRREPTRERKVRDEEDLDRSRLCATVASATVARGR